MELKLKLCKHSKQNPSLSNFISGRNIEENLKKPCKHTLLLVLNVVLMQIALSVKYKEAEGTAASTGCFLQPQNKEVTSDKCGR